MTNLNEVLFLTPKNDKIIGNPFLDKGFKVESIYKNDHYSKRKFALFKLFNRENKLFAFDESLIKKYNKIIISECPQISTVARYIYNKQCDLKVYLWNTIEKELINEVKKLQNMGVKIFSFDIGDCRKYHLNYNCQPYPYLENIIFDTPKIEYDCYFCAADKNRINELIILKDFFKKQGISFKFKVLKEKHKNYNFNKERIDGIDLIDKAIDYNIILKETSSAKCIVELLKMGQEGYTLRTIESLFLSKKLITNNKNIIKEDFYNPNNIFILDNNYNNIKKFLERPYKSISNEIKEKYLTRSWVSRFFEVKQ